MRILQLRMDVDEFGEFLRTIGIEPMKHVLQECFDEFDEEESGEICFDAFYKVMRLLAQREGFSKTEVRDFETVFNKFDTYGNDEIDVKELQQVLMYLGIPTTLAECQDVAEIVDLDDSGYVDFQEFLMCMRLFRDRELTELKQTLQDIGTDHTESIEASSMLDLLQRTGYVADQEVVNEVLVDIGMEEQDERIGLGSLWKFLVFFRQREGLTRAEMMHTRQAFRKYASGEEDDDEAFREVQTDDVTKILRLIGYPLALEDQKQLVAQVDIDRSATLNILELMKLVRFIREKRTHELQAAIQMHDRSDTGALSEKEALAAFKELGCLREDLTALPAEVLDDFRDGFISHAAFTRCVQHYDEQVRKQLIESGGYTFDQMDQLRRQFISYDWDSSGDVSKKDPRGVNV
ncbi:Calmodulin-like protein 12 (Touch-induced calmodulin-related protein 3) [Durusdinium trenchii]|uniref:Calmodulin n=1 Tax=Durusdinium trenchii TaxID=1381693 RepID=A0ABP0PB08_9DINO